MTTRRNWQRRELLLALNLYCQLPFGQYHRGNSKIIELSNFIGRTPDALAMKLSNFASLDTYHRSRGIKGLQNASQADRAVWDEFNTDWGELAIESEIAYAQLSSDDPLALTDVSSERDIEAAEVSKATEAERTVRIRLGQQFFRKVIMSSYASKCCICGMPIPELLIASHIIPWRDNASLRINPYNGLCLCALHDKGFDRGFITIGTSYEVIIGSDIASYLPTPSVYSGFKIYEGKMISLPDKFHPRQEYLAIHRANYFLG